MERGNPNLLLNPDQPFDSIAIGEDDLDHICNYLQDKYAFPLNAN